MQTPLYELIPWWMVAVTLFLAGMGSSAVWLWRDSGYRRGAIYSWRDIYIASFIFCAVSLFVTVDITVKRSQRLHELAQTVTPYPGAMPELIFFKPDPGTWTLETPDSFEKVRAFYSRLADGEKVPFRHIRDSDTHFVFGQGTNAVSIFVDEESGDTIIDYRVPARPQAF